MALCGCVAQEHGEKLLKRMKLLDLVVGPDCYHLIPGLLQESRRVALTEQGGEDYEGFQPVREEFPRAFVNVIRGCDNFCTYCIVPHVRGRERSRPRRAVLSEIESLADAGFREITLLGQNVNSYRNEDVGFPELLRKASEAVGERCRLRFVTSNPRDLTTELVSVMASADNICNQFHLPAQSGSDRVLRAMNRGYTRKGYIEKVNMLREAMPDIVLSTDMIAGFPGETPEEFEESVTLLEEIRFDYAFLFRYSERQGTAAVDITPRVPVKERLRRLNELQELQMEITLARSRELTGSVRTVLVTGPARMPGQLAARTAGNRMVILESTDHAPGDMIEVRITRPTATHTSENLSFPYLGKHSLHRFISSGKPLPQNAYKGRSPLHQFLEVVHRAVVPA